LRSTDFGSAFELISEIDVTRQGTTQDNSGHFRTSSEQTGKRCIRFNRFYISAAGEDTVAVAPVCNFLHPALRWKTTFKAQAGNKVEPDKVESAALDPDRDGNII